MKLVEVKAVKEFASTFLADPILKMAVNAVLDNAPEFVGDNHVGDKLTPTDKDINVLTNADRIRAMTDEELAEFLGDDDRCCPPKHPNCRKYVNDCSGCFLEWLKRPKEEV